MTTLNRERDSLLREEQDSLDSVRDHLQRALEATLRLQAALSEMRALLQSGEIQLSLPFDDLPEGGC